MSSPSTSSGYRGARKRQGHQQCADELRRDVAPYAHRRFEAQPPRMHRQRRVTLRPQVVDLRADSAQGFDQVAYRPLVHAGHTGKPVLAAGERERRGQRPERGPRVSEPQLGAANGKSATDARDAQRAVRPLTGDTEALQRLEHHLRVVRIKQTADARVAACKRRKQQDAVRNALRTGQPHASRDAPDRLQPQRIHRSGLRNRTRHRASDCVRRGPARRPSPGPPHHRPQAARGSIRAARRIASARRASASRLATQMSRHISGWLEAMRVKSRNPPAA